MIQKFRWKFIRISVLSLLIVLLFSIGSLVSINFYRDTKEVKQVMDTLVKNDGNLIPQNSNQINRNKLTIIDGQINPEAIYQYHYFTVVFNQNGKPVIINKPKNFNLSEEKINNRAANILARRNKDGIVRFDSNNYHYRIFTNQAGQQTITFLNTTLIYAPSWSLLRLGLILGGAGLIIFAIILGLLSRKAIAPIISAYQKQRQFITNAGHELKTPLAIISANNEMQEILGNDNEWTKSTDEQIKRLTELINNLVSLAKLSETNELTLSSVDASKIVNKACQSFSSVMQKNDLKFDTSIDPDIHVLAEEKSLHELVNIFLDNAQKYCDDNGMVNVSLHRNRLNTHATLTISNTYAKGKNANYQNFFDRFYREDESHNSKKNGFGIGLSLAQELVQIFKGKIKIAYHDETISFIIQLKLAKNA